jgi:arylsulfatase A-like enzyme
MLHRIIVLLMLLYFVFSANLLFAQNESERISETPPVFNELDKNSDGRLSRDELSNPALFERMDANANGWVTIAEAQRWAQRRAKRESSVEVSQNTDSNYDAVVYPPDPETESARRSLLEKIDDVTTGEKRPPNIVLILADDLGYADTGVYGSTPIPTPHIDALAAEGTHFTNAYVTAASCSPSRAGLISGRYQQRFGFEFNTSSGAITHRCYRGLDPAAITLAEVLHKAGYATGMFGKWHLGTHPHLHPQSRGFDEFYGFLAGAHSFFPVPNEEPVYSTIMRGREAINEPKYLTDAIARETVRFIDEHHDRPFFAYVPFNAVHTPIQATPEYQERFSSVSDPKRRDYYAMTSALDDAVGKIVDAIDRQGLTNDTLIVFLNDNGGPIYTGVQSNGPLRLGKLFLFEGGVRVPMIMRWPGVVPPTTVFDGTVSSLDVFPTVSAAANIDLQEVVDFDGIDLLPFLSGDANGNPHQTLFWSNGPNVAVRSGNWKLIKSYENTWLFNLAEDLGEENNLATDRPEIVERLESELEEWKSEMREPAWPSKPQRNKTPIDGMIYELNI